jgi:hypothetical protein
VPVLNSNLAPLVLAENMLCLMFSSLFDTCINATRLIFITADQNPGIWKEPPESCWY